MNDYKGFQRHEDFYPKLDQSSRELRAAKKIVLELLRQKVEVGAK